MKVFYNPMDFIHLVQPLSGYIHNCVYAGNQVPPSTFVVYQRFSGIMQRSVSGSKPNSEVLIRY